jgi:hypothetical protein
MQLAFEERPVSTRAMSATREVVKSRQHLDSALRSLEVAIRILSRPDRRAASVPISALERVVGQLEDAASALWEASP